MRWLRLVALILSIVLLIGVVLYWQSFTTVIFAINGQQQQIRVRAATVDEAVAAAGLVLDEADTLEPAPDTLLENAGIIKIGKPGQVALRDGDTLTRLYTNETDPIQILRNAGATIQLGDEVLVDGLPLLQYISANQPRTIQIIRAITITIEDNGVPGLIRTTAATVGGAVRTSGLDLYLADTISPALDTPLTENMVIQITRAKPLTLIIDGRELRTRAQGETIGEVLINLGITLTGQDYAIPDESTLFTRGARIRVVRVTEEIEISSQPVPYQTIYQATDNLPAGSLIQAGQDGEQSERLRIRYEDGREVSRVLLDRTQTRAPIDEIIATGTGGN